MNPNKTHIQSETSPPRVAEIVLDRPLRNSYSYLIPGNLAVQIGQRVKIPFGNGNLITTGFCVAISQTIPDQKLKNVHSVFENTPLLTDHLLEFTRWIADYYRCGWGQVLQAVIPAGAIDFKEKTSWGFRIVPADSKEIKDQLSSTQGKILEFLRNSGPASAAQISKGIACTSSPIKRLLDKGYLEKIVLPFPKDITTLPDPLVGNFKLTPEQSLACEEIFAAQNQGGFKPFLIHGVTGSGKTEIYLQAISQTVRAGKQALVMVPEISLTPQTVERFKQRFNKVAILHSHLKESERGKNWLKVSQGEVDVVIGARSAVFAPLPNLGIIIVDEEHENSFKQDKTPRYNGRDIAVVRARMLKIPILLGSATPSLESWKNATKGNYRLLSMPNRVASQTLPEVWVVNMGTHPPATPSLRDVLSEALFREIKKTLASKGQVMLFLNRRGFHTLIRCPACGKVSSCTRCDLPMTFHKGANFLLCHHCGQERKPDSQCLQCLSPTKEFKGTGTEKLEEEIVRLFPGKVIRRMDSDSTKRPGSHEKILNAFREGLINILIGTQMIAKGLDFPNVRLVGVINPDFGLHIPDFRASERTFQLLSQVGGRAGRGNNPGRVIIQTNCPDHPSIQCAAKHDYLGFAGGELAHRQLHNFPPFSRLARIVIRSKIEAAVEKAADLIATSLREFAKNNKPPCKLKLLGPAKTHVFKLNELFRFHIQIHCDNHHYLNQLMTETLDKLKPLSGVDWIVDIDPFNFL